MRLLVCLLASLSVSASAQVPFSLQTAGDASLRGLAPLWSDVDGDGDTDLFMVNVEGLDPELGGSHTLFLNDGDGRLSIQRSSLGAGTVNVGDGIFVDLDGDGDRDLLLGSLSPSQSTYYRNDDGVFVPVNILGFTGVADVREVEPVDVNGDGRLDLFVSLRAGQPNFLLTQTETGDWDKTFVEAFADAGSTSMTCWSDMDYDGDLDVFVVNGTDAADIAYRNDDGVLTPFVTGAEGAAGTSSSSCDFADADGDADLDLFVSGATDGTSRLYLNDGAGQFAEVAAGPFPGLDDIVITAAWADLDLDGDPDLVTASRFQPIQVFLNDGSTFTASTVDGSSVPASYRTGVAPFDVDGDGDLDLAVGAGFNDTYEPSFVLRNDSAPGARWLGIRLRSDTGNREGIGARISVFSTMEGAEHVQVQEVLAHTNRLGQSDFVSHFGFGPTGSVDSVRVEWPSGAVNTVVPDEIDAVIEIVESIVVGAEPSGTSAFAVGVRPNPSEGAVQADVTLAAPGRVSMALFDAQGRRIWTTELDAAAGTTTTELPPVAAGTYVLRVQTEGGTATQLVTVAR